MGEKAIELNQHKEYLENIDPFEIPLDLYHSLSSKEHHFLVKHLYATYGNWILYKFSETKVSALVLCDRKVVYASKNEYEPADSVIESIESKIGKPCYIINPPPLIEESARWSELWRGDYYPTLSISIGRVEWDDEKVFKDSLMINCDFDTGNPAYTVTDENLLRTVSDDLRRLRTKPHLGILYSYRPYPLKVGVMDNKNGRCLGKIVEGVVNWEDVEQNPYKVVNPNREGFVGRDIMLELLVKITLDPESKESTWQLL